MKSSDLWKNLPTPAELLENPQVRSVVDRLNPSVVTARVRGFLDEVRGEVAERADAAGLPTLSELAQRVSRYLSGGGNYSVGAAINATGRMWGDPWLSAPLAESAIERMLLTAQDFTTGAASGHADADAAGKLCELTGAPSAAVLNSQSAAIGLALRTIEPKRVVVARGEVATIESGCRLTDLATAAGVELVEVGAADRVTEQDYADALAGAPSVVLRLGGTKGGQEETRPSLESLLRLAQQHSAPLVVDLGCAALGDVEGLKLSGTTAQTAVAGGATMAIMRGDGLLGGPSCGLVLGETQSIDRIRQSPMLATCRIDPLRAAALAATLDLHTDANKARLNIPMLSLATTPLENLRTRAERLAPQAALSPYIAEAQAVELPQGMGVAAPLLTASWGVELRPEGQNCHQLSERLLANTPAVRCRRNEETLVLDLRTVLPRQDLGLLAALGGEESAESDESAAE